MTRILTALVLIPVFCYIVLWAPQWAFLAVVAAVAILCFHEYANLTARNNISKPGLFGYVAGLLILLLPDKDPAFFVLIAILGMALSLRSRELSEYLGSAAALLLGVAYVFGSLRCGIDLRAISPYWLFFGLSLNWAGDIAALYVGRLLGRHKLAARISPGKSWEGAAGSLLASVVYGALYIPRLLPTVPLAEGLGLAAVANIAGQFGDLCESALKRGADVKDSGTLLPGHGGWLDRVDSTLFALPVVYFVVSNFHW
ncbi:MAG TPA: phosphatidate cytidylyltransferase [Bryobacteraceae bacterium]|jgi:phosphatidate cytidylyltransferase|nr:phosphatidate cytidylyltransferase [Bryobacteraceae bacterium]